MGSPNGLTVDRPSPCVLSLVFSPQHDSIRQQVNHFCASILLIEPINENIGSMREEYMYYKHTSLTTRATAQARNS
jgi:hypothetical protein